MPPEHEDLDDLTDWDAEHTAAHDAQRRRIASWTPQGRLRAMDDLCRDLTALAAAGRKARDRPA